MMRDLTSQERRLLEAFAERMSSSRRERLLADVQIASVKSALDGESRLIFSLAGYERPPYHGQHAFPVEAKVKDADGALLSVVLYADENDRLYELELIRFEAGPVQRPDWATLQIYS